MSESTAIRPREERAAGVKEARCPRKYCRALLFKSINAEGQIEIKCRGCGTILKIKLER